LKTRQGCPLCITATQLVLTNSVREQSKIKYIEIEKEELTLCLFPDGIIFCSKKKAQRIDKE
jgi:hypothetical protein